MEKILFFRFASRGRPTRLRARPACGTLFQNRPLFRAPPSTRVYLPLICPTLLCSSSSCGCLPPQRRRISRTVHWQAEKEDEKTSRFLRGEDKERVTADGWAEENRESRRRMSSCREASGGRDGNRAEQKVIHISSGASAPAGTANEGETKSQKIILNRNDEGADEEAEFRIDVEMTPNPLARKFFVHGVPLLPPDTHSFTSKSFTKRDKCDAVPFIKSLFEISDFTSILVAAEYLTVVKSRVDAWEELEPKIRACFLRHLRAGDFPLLHVLSRSSSSSSSWNPCKTGSSAEVSATKATAAGAATSSGDPVRKQEKHKESDSSQADEMGVEKHRGGENEDDEDVAESIKSLLYLRARPMLLADGGDLEMIRFDADTGIVWVFLKGSCQGCPSSLITVKRGMKQMLQYYIPEVEDVRQCDENGDPLEDEDEE